MERCIVIVADGTWRFNERKDGGFAITPPPVDETWRLEADGVFETVLLLHGRPVELAAHLNRLSDSARARALRLPDPSQMTAALRDACAQALLHPFAALRVVIVRATQRDDCDRCGIGIASVARPDFSSVTLVPIADSRPHSDRVHKICDMRTHARDRSKAKGFGFDDAIWHDMGGFFTESTAAGFVWWDSRGVLHLGEPGKDALHSITRMRLARAAAKAGFDVTLQRLATRDIANAEGAALVSSLQLLRPVAAIGKFPLQSARRTETFARILLDETIAASGGK